MSGYSCFIAGIIQGSIAEHGVHAQDYRAAIREILETHLEGARVYCPFENHPRSIEYDDATASRVFFDHAAMAEETDLLVTYVPEASMGTAVEMYAAHRAGRAVLTISPLSENWTVKFLSNRLFGDLEAFREFAASGGLKEFLNEHYRRKQ